MTHLDQVADGRQRVEAVTTARVDRGRDRCARVGLEPYGRHLRGTYGACGDPGRDRTLEPTGRGLLRDERRGRDHGRQRGGRDDSSHTISLFPVGRRARDAPDRRAYTINTCP